MTIIAFPKKTDETAHHGLGQAFCMACQHEWEAVVPMGTTDLECPGCHTMKGRLRFEYYPPEGEKIRVCNCGNSYFYLTEVGHLCANCGIYQTY